MDEIEFRTKKFDIPINDLDAICMLVFSSPRIKPLYGIDREERSESIVEYAIRFIDNRIPKLGEIRLSGIGNQTIMSFHTPKWPTLAEENAYKQQTADSGSEIMTEEEFTLSVVKEKSGETYELKSIARGPQLDAWIDFNDRFEDSMKSLLKSQRETSISEGSSEDDLDETETSRPDSTEEEDNSPELGVSELQSASATPQPVLDEPDVDSAASAEQTMKNLKIYVPKSPKKLADWKKAYDIICDRRDQYKEEFLDGDSENAKPSSDDLKAAILSDASYSIGERTIRNIIRAGDAGLLK